MTPDPASIPSATLTSCQGLVLNPPLVSTSTVAAIGVILTLIGLILAYLYDRGRRYNYLADRWNELMNMNIIEWEFFDAEKTSTYKTLERPKLIKYNQHARMYWGAVEDIVRNDYPFERWLRRETFVDAYSDTIKDCIRLHHPWLNDNIATLFTYRKFRKHLSRKFRQELAAVSLDLRG